MGGAKEALRVGRRTVRVSRPGKVLFPSVGVTKADLARYYARVAPVMLPHVRDRPVTMQVFPDGVGKEGFYRKDVPAHFPDWVRTVEIRARRKDRTLRQLLLQDAATLAYLADQAVVPHVWLSRIRDLDKADRLVFDLDPATDSFGRVQRAARTFRDVLSELGLVPFVMTTGSRGAHVVVPLRPTPFAQTRAFAKDLARLVALGEPDLFTLEMRIAKRRGRVFLDWLRNAWAQTAVAPYAVRARPGAPVATPVPWEDLLARGTHARTWTVQNVFGRLDAEGDAWRGIERRKRALGPARRRLDAWLEEAGLSPAS